MWYQMVYLIPVLLPTLVIKTTNCDSDDVIVRYAGHAEAGDPPERNEVKVEEVVTEASIPPPTVIMLTQTVRPSTIYIPPPTTTKVTTVKDYLEEQTDGVVFIPNEAPVVRLEDEDDRNAVKLHDVLTRKDVGDVMDKHFRVETESPADIVFIMDKNKDKQEEKRPNTRRANDNNIKENKNKVFDNKLDCQNLNCTNLIQEVCGRKISNGKAQYRLFRNDCYFRKVNCHFKYNINRYEQTSTSDCKKIGAHIDERPPPFSIPKLADTPKSHFIDGRKKFSSRRSLARINGQFCAHACPLSCPDEYDPTCAISATGQKKVFVNHCKLDDNSCQFAVVWHKRPLAECVGGAKADVRNNRFFIGWMQKVGIIDKKGKLVLE